MPPPPPRSLARWLGWRENSFRDVNEARSARLVTSQRGNGLLPAARAPPSRNARRAFSSGICEDTTAAKFIEDDLVTRDPVAHSCQPPAGGFVCLLARNGDCHLRFQRPPGLPSNSAFLRTSFRFRRTSFTGSPIVSPRVQVTADVFDDGFLGSTFPMFISGDRCVHGPSGRR